MMCLLIDIIITATTKVLEMLQHWKSEWMAKKRNKSYQIEISLAVFGDSNAWFLEIVGKKFFFGMEIK